MGRYEEKPFRLSAPPCRSGCQRRLCRGYLLVGSANTVHDYVPGETARFLLSQSNLETTTGFINGSLCHRRSEEVGRLFTRSLVLAPTYPAHGSIRYGINTEPALTMRSRRSRNFIVRAARQVASNFCAHYQTGFSALEP